MDDDDIAKGMREVGDSHKSDPNWQRRVWQRIEGRLDAWWIRLGRWLLRRIR